MSNILPRACESKEEQRCHGSHLKIVISGVCDARPLRHGVYARATCSTSSISGRFWLAGTFGHPAVSFANIMISCDVHGGPVWPVLSLLNALTDPHQLSVYACYGFCSLQQQCLRSWAIPQVASMQSYVTESCCCTHPSASTAPWSAPCVDWWAQPAVRRLCGGFAA